MKFVLENNSWWQLKDNYVYNMFGGRHLAEPDLFTVEAPDWEDLDWSCLLDRESYTGWIAPDGTWFGCADGDHGLIAKFLLKSSETQLEQKGWVKIYRSELTHMRDWYVKNLKATQAQIDTLLEKGIYDKDIIIIER